MVQATLRSAEEVKTIITELLHWDSRIDASRIQVDVSNGKVMLTGIVTSYLERTNAVVDAIGLLLPEVTSVDERLVIRPPEEITTPGDAEIASFTRQAASWFPHLNTADIGVSVNERVITLEGTVEFFWQKFKAEEIASGILGVLKVNNRLTVRPKGRFKDEEIDAEIRSAIRRNTSFDPDSIGIEVTNGEVTLTGDVPDRIYSRYFENIVFTTRGVMECRNRLAIKPH